MLRWFRRYFGFSRSELSGLTVLLLLLLSISYLPLIIQQYRHAEEAEILLWQSEKAFDDEQKPATEYHVFDPNTEGSEGLLKLGFSATQIKNIERYRNAGGKFRKNEDLLKLYTVDEDLYSQLEPYITIERKPLQLTTKNTQPFSGSQPSRQEPLPEIDLNTCDSLELLMLPGIGPAFSSRIVRFRERLGGYVDKRQLMEVYGMDSLRFTKILPYLKLSLNTLKKIQVNRASFYDLSGHPYITAKDAYLVLKYREQHPPLKYAEEFFAIFPYEIVHSKKLIHYLDFE